MKASASWQNNSLSFSGTAATGFVVPMGSDDDGFRPMELLLVSLAGCTGMDVISILQKKRQDVTDFQVQIDSDRATDHPKVFTHIRVHYVVRGRNIDPKAVERAVELSKDKYCSVSAMLSQAAQVNHTFEVVEEAMATLQH
ncbi:MAG: OsmC family protein [Chloroflexi bacterium]|nr:OsmC family protein [Chloroflexota bacterium]MBP8057625.1 OsmC family protein [Chloroflexota bacterium]